jgi:hypothetical protein
LGEAFILIGSLLLVTTCLGLFQAPMGPTEKDLREDFRKAYSTSDVSARVEAVAIFGNETRDLPDGGASKLVAKTLAGTLDDDAMEVCQAGVGALGWGRHPDTAVEALGDLLPELRKETEKLSTRPDDESRARRAQVAATYNTACEALGRHKDDRAVDALVDELRKLRPRNGASNASEVHARSLARALLQLGSHDAVETVVKTTQVYSGAVLNRNRNNATAVSLHESLSIFSEEIGYGPPEYSLTYDQAWREWFKEHEDEFEKKLGKLVEPPPAPEYRRPDRNPNRRRPGRPERP